MSIAKSPQPGTVQQNDRVEFVYRRLRREILAGELAPGTVLSQVQLASRLETSRTPLREALKRLLAENLVAGDFNQRMRVSELNLDDFDQMYALRIAIEPIAVTAAMERFTRASREELSTHVDAMEDAISTLDIPRFRAEHRAFHLGLIRGSGARIERLLEDLWDNSERYRLTYLHHDYEDRSSPESMQLRTSQYEHRAMLKAALTGDAVACGAELVRHMERAVNLVYEEAAAPPRARLTQHSIRRVAVTEG